MRSEAGSMPTLGVDGRALHWESHGEGEPALVIGGWGTFCRKGFGAVPREAARRFRVVVFDYPGIGESEPDDHRPASTAGYASDAALLLDELGLTRVRVIGLVGLGACVAQELAISRPDLVHSLVMTGTWAGPDPTFADQIDGLRRAHVKGGFEAFQLLVASFSFTHEYYNAQRARLIGPDGAWSDLRGRAEAHSRLVDACLGHETRGRLATIACPTLVLHAGRDVITRPDMTRELEEGIPGARGVLWEDLAHVIAGKDQKVRFDRLLCEFFDANP